MYSVLCSGTVSAIPKDTSASEMNDGASLEDIQTSVKKLFMYFYALCVSGFYFSEEAEGIQKNNIKMANEFRLFSANPPEIQFNSIASRPLTAEQTMRRGRHKHSISCLRAYKSDRRESLSRKKATLCSKGTLTTKF